jgi:hypothetical protein
MVRVFNSVVVVRDYGRSQFEALAVRYTTRAQDKSD